MFVRAYTRVLKFTEANIFQIKFTYFVEIALLAYINFLIFFCLKTRSLSDA